MDHVGGAVVPKEASVFSVFVVKTSVQRDGWVSGVVMEMVLKRDLNIQLG